MGKRPTCFFCYAWATDERYKKLCYVRSRVRGFDSRIDVILDKHDYRDNQDFEELRERIREYDLVIVFCTPDLKRIVRNQSDRDNRDREVLKEYQIIEQRYRSEPESVFPVILEGDKEKSLLDLFRNRNARNYVELGIRKNKRGRYSIAVRTNQIEFRRHLEQIAHTALMNHQRKLPEYRSRREAMDKLFSLTDTTDIPESCLVRLDLYDKVMSQSCYFIVGRKGSGKSTFIRNLHAMDSGYFEERYKQMCPISAEAFQHEEAYETLVLKNRADRGILPPHQILCVLWQVYIFLQTLVTIRSEIESHAITIDDKRFRIFDRMTRKLLDMIGLGSGRGPYESIASDGVPRSVFLAAVSIIDDQFMDALDGVSEGALVIPSYSLRVSAQHAIWNAFGRNDTESFVRALRQCKKKIFISLDGFDTHSEAFRAATARLPANSYEHTSRDDYERQFFTSLIKVVSEFKEHKYKDEVLEALSGYLDFCIVLPKDRYDQIVGDDRDSFKKQFYPMSWSAYELMMLLTRRLEYLAKLMDKNYRPPPHSSYFERMESALFFFRGLPGSVTMNVQGKPQQLSLFNYILRSSFWRPRDVISNLSCLLSYVVDAREQGDGWTANYVGALSEDNVKTAIKINARRIIEEELIGEYRNVFRNLGNVLDTLGGNHERMEVHEFTGLIANITFDATFAYSLSDVEGKLRALYQLGIIGLYFSPEFARRKGYQHHVCFSFNVGMEPLLDLTRMMGIKHYDFRDVSIIYNPIFTRYLELEFNTDELLGDWSDEYILSSYRMKGMIRPL